jgi:hypothetical protein
VYELEILAILKEIDEAEVFHGNDDKIRIKA